MEKGSLCVKAVFYLFCVLVLRKICIALHSMHYVFQHKDQVAVDRIMSSPSFLYNIQDMNNNTMIFFLNKHALNMTYNWLCNTANMPEVHENAFFVTLDNETRTELGRHFPHIHQIHMPTPALKDPFNYGDGRYQLFYLLRANTARALLRFGKSFWMAQQDTFWRTPLSAIDLNSQELRNSDIVFDSAGDSVGTLIAGGYFYVRATEGSLNFFISLSNTISWWYAPDNAYMTALCYEREAKCANLPFNTISNWQWMTGSSKSLPNMIQFDGYTQLGGKLNKMREMGFYFMNNGENTCNRGAFTKAVDSLQRDRKVSSTEESHAQFALYTDIITTCMKSPILSTILYKFFLPYAHFCMLTM